MMCSQRQSQRYDTMKWPAIVLVSQLWFLTHLSEASTWPVHGSFAEFFLKKHGRRRQADQAGILHQGSMQELEREVPEPLESQVR